jgi:hypothetical protein
MRCVRTIMVIPVVAVLLGSWPPRLILACQEGNSVKNSHADHVMGFSQEKTTHHFILTKDGGTIQVEVNNANDASIRDHIRMHLQHITKSFAAGDFEDPIEVHDQVPPGVPTMQKLKEKIGYTFQSTPKGGRVLIQTANQDALEAIHQYLRFQIQEHKTGDPLAAP